MKNKLRNICMYNGAKSCDCNTRKMWAKANNKNVQKEKFK